MLDLRPHIHLPLVPRSTPVTYGLQVSGGLLVLFSHVGIALGWIRVIMGCTVQHGHVDR